MRSCWQIRQDLSDKNGKNGWLVNCAECAVNASETSCWEQCGGSPCCCAPIHVTCDFCVLYLEHRREIAEYVQSNGQSNPGTPTQTLAPARLPISAKGDRSATMEKLQLNIPDMWADHHVLKVRALLLAMPGVQDVIASSAFRMVALSYDPAVCQPRRHHGRPWRMPATRLPPMARVSLPRPCPSPMASATRRGLVSVCAR